MSLISSPCISSFSITVSAVYWSALVWFEGNFTFLSTLSANCLVHFSWFSIRHIDCTSYSLKELVFLSDPNSPMLTVDLLINLCQAFFNITNIHARAFLWIKLISGFSARVYGFITNQ